MNRATIRIVEHADELTVGDDIAEAELITLRADLARRRAEGDARVRAWHRRTQEQYDAYEAAGCNAIARWRRALTDEVTSIDGQLCTMTPTTMAGAAALLHVAINYGVPAGYEDTGDDMASVRPVINALKYLEGGSS